jgi:hypothetical protein
MNSAEGINKKIQRPSSRYVRKNLKFRFSHSMNMAKGRTVKFGKFRSQILANKRHQFL